MLIYSFKVLLISLKMLIQLSDSTNKKMNKSYYDANVIRVERMWSGGEVSLIGSHVTLPKVTELNCKIL